MRILCWPRRSPRSASRRLPGGERRSSSRTAASIIKTFARARRWICNGIPRTACPAKTAADRLSAKLLINSYRNEKRYVPSSSTNAYRARPVQSFNSVLVVSRAPLTRFPTVIGQFLEQCSDVIRQEICKPILAGSIPTRETRPSRELPAYPAPFDGNDSRVNWTVSPDANWSRISAPAYLTVNGLPSRDSMLARTS